MLHTLQSMYDNNGYTFSLIATYVRLINAVATPAASSIRNVKNIELPSFLDRVSTCTRYSQLTTVAMVISRNTDIVRTTFSVTEINASSFLDKLLNEITRFTRGNTCTEIRTCMCGRDLITISLLRTHVAAPHNTIYTLHT